MSFLFYIAIKHLSSWDAEVSEVIWIFLLCIKNNYFCGSIPSFEGEFYIYIKHRPYFFSVMSLFLLIYFYFYQFILFEIIYKCISLFHLKMFSFFHLLVSLFFYFWIIVVYCLYVECDVNISSLLLSVVVHYHHHPFTSSHCQKKKRPLLC